MTKDEIGRVQALIHAGKLAPARAFLYSALTCDADDWDALFNLGVLDYLEGRFSQAAEAFQRASRLKDDVACLLYLAKCLRMGGQLQQACAAYGHLLNRFAHDRNLRREAETVLMETRSAETLQDRFGQGEALHAALGGSPIPQSVTVGFETKVWEEDWSLLLTEGRLERMIELCDFPFADRAVIINNVADSTAVRLAADALVARGVLTRWADVAAHAEAALSHMRLSAATLEQGYVYSIAELVGLLTARTDYLVHFSGDSILQSAADWITPSIRALRADPAFAVANPIWGPSAFGGPTGFADAAGEAIAETPDFFIGYGFSDQCYLVDVGRFRGDIYRYDHYTGDRYPTYGGPLFEKRVDAWMRTTGRLRLTCKRASYLHQNIRGNRLVE
nr:tetratricopeptide repeat protein [Azospirillum sp. 412522]